MLIRRSLVVVVLLLIAYAIVLPATRIDGFLRGSQFEQVVMQAEAYQYANDPPTTVLVGSSISFWLRDLPATWANLAMPGEGCLTGLDIVAGRTDALPDRVVVEVNVIERPINRELTGALRRPVVSNVRGRLAMFRETNEPSHVLYRCLHLLPYYTSRIADALGMNQPESVTGSTASSDLNTADRKQKDASPASDARHAGYTALRQVRLEVVRQMHDPSMLAMRVARLQQLVDQLRSAGVQVVLVEVPEDAQTYTSPRRVQVRNALAKVFPADQYTWLGQPLAGSFQTPDGVHMTPDSASRYAHWLVDQVRTARHLAAVKPPAMTSP